MELTLKFTNQTTRQSRRPYRYKKRFQTDTVPNSYQRRICVLVDTSFGMLLGQGMEARFSTSNHSSLSSQVVCKVRLVLEYELKQI